jgi:hypothetical protein
MKFMGYLLAAGTVIVCSAVHAQNCDSFFPLKKGSTTEMLEYNGNKVLTGKSVSTITDRKDNGGMTEATMHNDQYDASGKLGGSADLIVKCDGKTLFMDMSQMGNRMDRQKGKDKMDVKMEGGFLEVPVGLKAGDVLKDGVMTMHMSEKGREMGTMTMTFHRKVEAEESVTVPAGTFKCMRVVVEVESAMDMMGMKRPMGKTKSIDWFSWGNGPVKSESYGQDGKLIRYSVLNKISK